MNYMNSGSGTMKLQEFEESNYKKKGIMVFSVSCVLLITGIFLYQSFALFQVNEDFNLIHGNVEDPGDLYFAYYIDDTITQDMPSKDSGYTLSEKSFCNNGVTITWDEEEWMAKVYYKNYKKENSFRTKCTLYFEEKKEPPKPSDEVKDYIIAKAPEGTLILDDETEDHNTRFVGKNPNNYVYFNCDDSSNPTNDTCELWRIIGIMNNVEDSEGNKESRIKLIRNESIGEYSWDTSDSTVNSGYGINEWSQADVMKLMNPGYEDESVGGSLYWNRASGECYNFDKNKKISCDFSEKALKEQTKTLIDNVVWYTGTSVNTNENNIGWYKAERSNTHGKNCSSGSYCNDTVARTTSWLGQVALVSMSDYGFSTASSCLENYDTHNRASCNSKSWIFKKRNEWLITPKYDNST